MSVALYMRVSKGRGQDTASQEPDLKRWARAQEEPSAFYVDKVSGKTMDRPEFNRLMADVRTGKVRTVVVWRLDRLGRTASGLTALFDDLRPRKVNLISLKEGLDLATPAGTLLANVLASVAQFETEVRAERIHAGLEAAREKGRKLGPAHGSRKGKRLKVTPEHMTTVLREIGAGNSISAIARVTGLSRDTIYTMIPATASRPRKSPPEP
jgi:DNA invertase Pin-like site-specific DNA recombinase